jgi:hypothetical protein
MGISGILHNGSALPVLVDDGPVAIRNIAETITYGFSSPDWYGGNRLSLLAPGLGCNSPWGDERESPAHDYFVLDLPDARPQLDEALAQWIITVEYEFEAALVLEPLDRNGTLEREGRTSPVKRVCKPCIVKQAETEDARRTANIVDRLVCRSQCTYGRPTEMPGTPVVVLITPEVAADLITCTGCGTRVHMYRSSPRSSRHWTAHRP